MLLIIRQHNYTARMYMWPSLSYMWRVSLVKFQCQRVAISYKSILFDAGSPARQIQPIQKNSCADGDPLRYVPNDKMPAADAGECLACRLLSGCGVMAIGAYIYNQSKGRRKIEMRVMQALAAGAIGLGIARLLNMEFLKAYKKS